MDDTQVCREILKLLNQFANQYGLSRYGLAPQDFINKLDISKQQLIVNIDFLYEEGYIDLLRSLGCHFNSARLTSRGRKLLMNKSEFNSAFPMTTVTYVHGNNNITGNNISVGNSFNSVNNVIDKSDLNENLKAELKSFILDLTKDLDNKKLDENKIKSFFTNVLKRTSENMVDLIPTITTTTIKSLLTYLGINI